MTTFNSFDGTEIFYKDWGNGQPVVFSHGWPLSGDAWEDQMLALADAGYRVIAHDRRGHGRSGQPWDNNTMDAYADDLNALIEKLNLKNVILVGHSTGGGEVTRYIGRHGTSRVAGLVLVGAVTPGMLKTSANPNGVPMAVFDDIRANTAKDRSQFFYDLSEPFYGINRNKNAASEGVRESFRLIGLQGSLKSELDSIAAFSESDFTEDLKKVNVPLLIIHGDDDQIVPYANSAVRVHELVKGSELRTYKGGDHGLPTTHKDELSADILAFAQKVSTNAELKKAS